MAAPATQASFKNCTRFTKCITKINGTTIDDAEELNLVMLMHNLIQYSSNYPETTTSLWFYSKDEATSFNTVLANTKNYFKYKTKLLGKTVAQSIPDQAKGILKSTKITVPLKNLSNVWR